MLLGWSSGGGAGKAELDSYKRLKAGELFQLFKMSCRSYMSALIMREYSEFRQPPRIMDMRGPCPETAENMEAFVKHFFSDDFSFITRIKCPKWLFKMEDSDLLFIGEILLLAYPSLEKIPDGLDYPRILLEHYTSAETCRLTKLPIPICIDVFVNSFEEYDYPHGLTFLTMIENINSKLIEIDLTGSELVSSIYTEQILCDLLDGKFPRLERLEFDLGNLTDKSIMSEMREMPIRELEITVHVNRYTLLRESLDYCEWWEALLPHRKNLVFEHGLPLTGASVKMSILATKLVLSSGQFSEPVKPMELLGVRTLVIENVYKFQLETFKKHLLSLRVPCVQKLEIYSHLVLEILANILERTEIKTLRHFRAVMTTFNVLSDPPALSEDFKYNFREQALKRTLKVRKDLKDWAEPFDLDFSALVSDSESENGSGSSDDEIVAAPVSAAAPLDKNSLRNDCYSEETKLVLRNVLSALASQEELDTLSLAFNNIGGFTASLLRFLLRNQKRNHRELHVLPVSLQGGLFISLIPVVCGLARNWDELSFVFWCPGKFADEAKLVVSKTLASEKKFHSRLELIVNCETSLIHGLSVKSKQTIRIFPSLDECFLFGELKLDATTLRKLLGHSFEDAESKLVDLGKLASRYVAGWTPGKPASDISEIAASCDHRNSSAARIAELIGKMDELDLQELNISNQLFSSFN
ncbi:hypothetical protein HDE_00450 [Halotydeus destructor]|nr:hypothetical protein HDE_00450 [Halotydeus destructor]